MTMSLKWLCVIAAVFALAAANEEEVQTQTLAHAVRKATPSHLQECYLNTTMLNRYNRPGMTMDYLIYLLRKIENHPEMRRRDMRQTLSGVINRYKLDGLYVIWRNTTGKVDVLIDRNENERDEILKEISSDKNQQLPEDVLAQHEECALHWMISHLVNKTRRYEENHQELSLYQNQDTNRQRRSLISESIPKSIHPSESGVVYTKYGTVAAGTLLEGILSGLMPGQVKVKNLIPTHEDYPSDIYEKEVINTWAATLSGDLAQTAMLYGTFNVKLVGPNGRWNDTRCRSEFILDKNATGLTEAEVNGGMDGIILGLQAKNWDASGRRTSHLLNMYYSEDGVVYEPKYRACDRKTLYRDDIDKKLLKTQAYNFAYVYQPKLSEIPLIGVNETRKNVDRAYGDLEDYITNSIDYRCNERLMGNNNQENKDKKPYVYTRLDLVDMEVITDLYIIADMDIDRADERQEVKEIMAGVVNRLGNGSRVALYIGQSTELREIYKLRYNDDLTCIACNILDLDLGRTSQMDFVQVLHKFNEILNRDMWYDIKHNVKTITNKVLLIISPKTEHPVSVKAEEEWEDFIDENAYLQLLVVGDQTWSDLEVRSGNLIDPSMSVDKMSTMIANRINKFPASFLSPNCTEEKPESEKNTVDGIMYLTPGEVHYYELKAIYFNTADEFKVKFNLKDGAEATICHSRSNRYPNVNSDEDDCEYVSKSEKMFTYKDACEDVEASVCDSLYYSVEVHETSSKKTCQDIQCTRPDQGKIELYLEDLKCGACSLLASPLLWLLTVTLAWINYI